MQVLLVSVVDVSKKKHFKNLGRSVQGQNCRKMQTAEADQYVRYSKTKILIESGQSCFQQNTEA